MFWDIFNSVKMLFSSWLVLRHCRVLEKLTGDPPGSIKSLIYYKFRKHIFSLCGGAQGEMIISIENRHCNLCSNPGSDSFHFTLHKYASERYASVYSPFGNE